MIRFTCSRCRAGIEAPEDRGGRRVRCPRCGQSQPVPTLLPVKSAPGTRTAATALLRRLGSLRPAYFPPWSYGSPAGLFLALLLFLLPWIEVRCDRPIANSGSRTLVEQSGLQAAYGGYWENPVFQTARKERESRLGKTPATADQTTMSWAPLMVLYPILLLAGILCGFIVQNSFLRSVGLMACSASSLVLLYLQAHRGFPLEQAVNNPLARDATAEEMVRSALETSKLVEMRHTGWFWLTVAAVLASLSAACVEWYVTTGRSTVFKSVTVPPFG